MHTKGESKLISKHSQTREKRNLEWEGDVISRQRWILMDEKSFVPPCITFSRVYDSKEDQILDEMIIHRNQSTNKA
jgi:hypothetical protein